jgi:hypothetical protein
MRRVLEFPRTQRRRDAGATEVGRQRHTGPSYKLGFARAVTRA